MIVLDGLFTVTLKLPTFCSVKTTMLRYCLIDSTKKLWIENRYESVFFFGRFRISDLLSGSQRIGLITLFSLSKAHSGQTQNSTAKISSLNLVFLNV